MATFARAGKQWTNLDNVSVLVPAAGRKMIVKLNDGSKLRASEEETAAFLERLEIDEDDFFADVDAEPEVAPEPVDWLTPAPDAEEEAKAK